MQMVTTIAIASAFFCFWLLNLVMKEKGTSQDNAPASSAKVSIGFTGTKRARKQPFNAKTRLKKPTKRSSAMPTVAAEDMFSVEDDDGICYD